MSSLSVNLKDLLRTKKVSEARLSDCAGMPVSDLLTRIEKGHVEFRTLEQIAKELRISIYGLLVSETHQISRSANEEFQTLKDENEKLRNRVYELEKLLKSSGISNPSENEGD
jgi:hypothetical protein